MVSFQSMRISGEWGIDVVLVSAVDSKSPAMFEQVFQCVKQAIPQEEVNLSNGAQQRHTLVLILRRQWSQNEGRLALLYFKGLYSL